MESPLVWLLLGALVVWVVEELRWARKLRDALSHRGQRTMERRRFVESTLADAGVHLRWEPIIESDSADPDLPEIGNMTQIGWRLTVENRGEITTQEYRMKGPIPWHQPPGGVWVEME